MTSTCQDSGLVPVTPIKPAAPWIGGKRNLAGRLVKLIQATPHTSYAEPFVGMGGIFFRRSMRPRSEVINDFNRDVANLFRILREHYTPFVEMIRYQLPGRADFDRLNGLDPATLTDLQRAARFLYLQCTTFGGKVAGRTFGVDPGRPVRWDPVKIVPVLDDLRTRLSHVLIECLPYAEFIPRYDRPGTLFYLDPPYHGAEDYYGKNLFSSDDYALLAELLAKLKARFILSINDTPLMRELFARFEVDRVKATYTVNGKKPRAFGELIVTGPK